MRKLPDEMNAKMSADDGSVDWNEIQRKQHRWPKYRVYTWMLASAALAVAIITAWLWLAPAEMARPGATLFAAAVSLWAFVIYLVTAHFRKVSMGIDQEWATKRGSARFVRPPAVDDAGPMVVPAAPPPETEADGGAGQPVAG